MLFYSGAEKLIIFCVFSVDTKSTKLWNMFFYSVGVNELNKNNKTTLKFNLENEEKYTHTNTHTHTHITLFV